jgi:DNA-binding SARP family transcriptional activator
MAGLDQDRAAASYEWTGTDFRVLGPLTVRYRGKPLPIPASKPQALVASLLLHANEPVSADRLIELLWYQRPPARARNTLQNHMLRLRRALGSPTAGRIRTCRAGYAIDVQDAELDLDRFRCLREAGEAAADRTAWAQAYSCFTAALTEWSGDPLAGIDAPGLHANELPALTEMKLLAAEARFNAGLKIGRHAELLVELQTMAAAYRLRERLQEFLILALYRNGARSAALSAFQQIRRLYVAELGVEPGPGLQALQQQVLRNDPGLLAELPAGRGGARATRTGAPPATLAAAPGPLIPQQLPACIAHLAGRADELRQLTALADTAGRTAGAVAISAIGGTAGVGKTALALHWTHRVAARFPDGQLYVNLRGFDPAGAPVDPADALYRFLLAFGLSGSQIPAGVPARAALYRSLLAGKRILVVLDNARDEGQVRPLLPGTNGCLTVVTSRNRLAGLAIAEAATLIGLGTLSGAEATALLAGRIGAARVAAEPESAAELCRLCVHLPLALATTAARAITQPDQPLATLAGELRDTRSRLDVLSTGDAQTDMRAALSVSYRSLAPAPARMFRLLGVHPGPDISGPAAASLAGIQPALAARLLSELTRANLVTEHTPGRFAFHDLLRAYAIELSAALGGRRRRSAIGRLLGHYVHTAAAAAMLLNPGRDPLPLPPAPPGVTPEYLTGSAQAMAWFVKERAVLLAAGQTAADIGLDTYARLLALAMEDCLGRDSRTG